MSCNESAAGRATARKGPRPVEESQMDSAGPVVIAPPAAKYVGGAVAPPGAVSGTVTLRGTLATAAPLSPGKDSGVCGRAVPDSSVQQKGQGLGNVVVWLDGVRKGKVIPLEKRLELESDHCILTPRVQAAVVGSAVNVIGHDDFRQHLHFVAGGEERARVLVLMGKDEQVIPSELPARTPGLVIVRDADHPWPRAFLAVFDHPYYAVTKPDGSFTIDGVPAGTYTLVAWHERTGKSEQKVTVAPGAAAKVALTLSGQ
ncbi:MAG: hypothetical protein JWN53_1611 [Gemmatimonadetes bacterium]|nr:hypothetical protein [Gemmatimonadota bacterium]